jgi:hypothetical protein
MPGLQVVPQDDGGHMRRRRQLHTALLWKGILLVFQLRWRRRFRAARIPLGPSCAMHGHGLLQDGGRIQTWYLEAKRHVVRRQSPVSKLHEQNEEEKENLEARHRELNKPHRTSSQDSVLYEDEEEDD